MNDGAGFREGVWPFLLREAARSTNAQVEWVESLYEELRIPLRRYVQQFGPRSDDPEDLVQEVFLRLLREVLGGKRIEKPRTWAFCVIHRMLTDDYRKRSLKQEHVAEISNHNPGVVATPEDDFLSSERGSRLETAIELLTVQERMCLELRSEGLRYREIADLLGLKLPTVASVVTRAIRKVSRHMHA